MTPVAIGDIQRTQGTRKPCIMPKTVWDTYSVFTYSPGMHVSVCVYHVSVIERSPDSIHDKLKLLLIYGQDQFWDRTSFHSIELFSFVILLFNLPEKFIYC